MKLFTICLGCFGVLPAIVFAQSSEKPVLKAPGPDSPGFFLPGTTTKLTIPLQPWQERREAFWKTVRGVNAHDPESIKTFDAILVQCETQPFARTPMESMDILGVFYAPKDDPAGVLTVISANAALGWYDALRFGSPSGRAEIANNERFFSRSFSLSGPATVAKFKAFLVEHPDAVKRSIDKGLAFAEKERLSPHYEVHWPTAYGLERTICALGGDCDGPKPQPPERWEDAWREAKARVIAAYLSGSPASTPPAEPTSR